MNELLINGQKYFISWCVLQAYKWWEGNGAGNCGHMKDMSRNNKTIVHGDFNDGIIHRNKEGINGEK